MTEQDIVNLITNLFMILIPGIIGFLLSQVYETRKYRLTSDKKEKSLRKLIDLETSRNISQVKLYWNNLIESHNVQNTKNGEFDYILLAEPIASIPFLNLSIDAWNANIGEIISVYDEKELDKLWNLYDSFGELSSLHMFLLTAKDTERNDRPSPRHHDDLFLSASVFGGYSFAKNAKRPAMKFKKLVEDILAFNSHT